MPEMDGLQLLSAVRKRYPLVPVVLMTSHGSETIAMEALRAGAASYVPKVAIPRDLRDTIQRLLSISTSQRSQIRLMGRMTKSQSTFSLENDPLLFAPLIQFLQDGAAQFGLWGDNERNRIGVALEEALANALYHGNLEVGSELREHDLPAYYETISVRRGQSPYRDRRIEVEAEFSFARASFTVRDDGAGFDPATLPDPTDPANLTKASGRGILLMKAFMDEVVYNAQGNSVVLIKNRQAKSESSNGKKH
jgi:anti-sigma regulatory factor (Ser/Thr protein kinase)